MKKQQNGIIIDPLLCSSVAPTRHIEGVSDTNNTVYIQEFPFLKLLMVNESQCCVRCECFIVPLFLPCM
jgi:hypothetical protein